MAHMQTFMKDLTDLNSAIESTLIPANFDIVQKYLATEASMTTALNGLPAEYARAYLQVQTLKYDENNDPVDVTAEEALSVPNSVIARYKQSWGNLNNTLESLRSRLDQIEITTSANVLEGRQVIEFHHGSGVLSYTMTAAEYSSKADIFSLGKELTTWYNWVVTSLNDFALSGSAQNVAGTMAQMINITPVMLAAYTLDGNAASTTYAPCKIMACLNVSSSFRLFVQIRGKTYTNNYSVPSGDMVDTILGVRDLLSNSGTGWDEVGIYNMAVAKNWTLPTNVGTFALDCKPNGVAYAEAPGGLATQSVDRVPLDIDLSDLDDALSAL